VTERRRQGAARQSPWPTITVVVPHRNQEADLAVCLGSLFAQAGGAFLREVIVVDNGSQRTPADVCGRYPGVHLLHEPERGPGPARNRGAAHASGDILAFIDADCRADSGWLAAIANAFVADPDRHIVGGDVRIPPQEGPATQVAAYESVFAYRMDRYIAREGCTGTGNLAVRRGTFLSVGPFRGITHAEDWEWCQRARALGHSIEFVPEMRVFHPPRASFRELTRKWDRQLMHNYAQAAGRPAGRLRLRGGCHRSPRVATRPPLGADLPRAYPLLPGTPNDRARPGGDRRQQASRDLDVTADVFRAAKGTQ
jgi:GT2 family glycosyltransferase